MLLEHFETPVARVCLNRSIPLSITRATSKTVTKLFCDVCYVVIFMLVTPVLSSVQKV